MANCHGSFQGEIVYKEDREELLGDEYSQEGRFRKGNLHRFNCHVPGHFARECPQPDRRLNNDRTMVAVGNNRSGAQVNSEKAMVAQSFD